MKENSKKESSNEKVEDNSTTSKNSDKKVDKKSTTSKSMGNFLKKFDFARDLETEKKDEDTDNSKSKDQSTEHDPHAFPMMGDFLSSDKLKNIKSGKNKLVMGICLFVGALLIILGVLQMIDSPDKVADNVIFGERAVFSVFLILMGILVIAGVFARKFLDKSFFEGINKEIESRDGVSSNSTKKEYQKGEYK